MKNIYGLPARHIVPSKFVYGEIAAAGRMSNGSSGKLCKPVVRTFNFLVVLLAGIVALTPTELSARGLYKTTIRVNVKYTMNALLEDEDTDGDQKITIDDLRHARSKRGDKQFVLTDVDGKRYDVSGVFYLANLLQELTLAQEAGDSIIVLDPEKIFERPTQHISRIIRDVCWEGLTRRMDSKGLQSILNDEKMIHQKGPRYIYGFVQKICGLILAFHEPIKFTAN